MKSLTSVLGWALLVAVLAVPSFLFYNWWTKSRQQVSSEIPQEAPQNIFPPQEKSPAPAPTPAPVPSRPAQPAPQAQAPAAPARQPQVQEPVKAPPAPPQQPSASAQAPNSAPVPAETAAVSTVTAQEVAPATAAVQGAQDGVQQKTASYYKPKTDRDPTLSPDDYQRIRDIENARLEAERMARLAERNRPRAPDITSRLQLQGIVGNAAIINGEMYAVGQSVLGAKILKVGANYVIVEHKGKKYRKVLQ